jgi:hypothetical protein
MSVAVRPVVRIGNGAGFLGDNLDAPRLLAEMGDLDYLTLEYLAELTMSILARSREKDPQAGYASDFIDVLRSLCPLLARHSKPRIVTNAGGVNPVCCARAAASVLVAAGLRNTLIGIVSGDDLLPRLDELRSAGCEFRHFDDGRPLAELKQPVVSANAYHGAEGIVQALESGARIVITGRVADASLTVGPAFHAFKWDWQHTDRLAGASVAGHLIECGAQVTGGYYRHWQQIDLANVGYPIAEVSADGNCVITKPANTGGVVDRNTVAAQLVYEIGDPAHYLTPDVDVDFTTVEIDEVGPDRVAVRGATGGPPPDTLKVSLAYRAGYTASGQLLVYGADCLEKARACAEIVFARVRRAGFELARTHVECLGSGDGVPQQASGGHQLPGSASGDAPREVVLLITVADPRREAVERFTREFAPLATAGPPGLAGYTAARGQVRPVFAYWPTTVPRQLVAPRVEVRSAAAWAEAAAKG